MLAGRDRPYGTARVAHDVGSYTIKSTLDCLTAADVAVVVNSAVYEASSVPVIRIVAASS